MPQIILSNSELSANVDFAIFTSHLIQDWKQGQDIAIISNLMMYVVSYLFQRGLKFANLTCQLVEISKIGQ